MQIYAYDSQGNLMHAASALRNSSYRCPECHSQVRARGGKMRQPHYYHPDATSCRLQGKSMTHLHIQNSLKKMLHPESVFLEHRFPEIGRVADLVWPAQKLVFEVQVSPISPDEVEERMRDYLRAGYRVVWILHDRRFNRYRQSAAEARLRYSPHYFTNINTLGKGIFYDQYSIIRFKKRVKRSQRLPVNFKKTLSINEKQIARQLPQDRKKWQLSFSGDLNSQPHLYNTAKTKTDFTLKKMVHFCSLPLRTLAAMYRIGLHLLLEKTTY